MTSQEPDDAPPRRPPTPVGPPVDPFVRGIARPYGDDEPETASTLLTGDAQAPINPPRTEQERNKQYERAQDEQSPPKPEPGVIGKYVYQAPPYTIPPDPLRQYVSGPKPRKRRSDWPILVFALVVAAVVAALCCLGGFAVFSSWHPFKG
ncbi:MAG TPA: hypothetical protein VH561_09570 [Micromonosporaceae bacterium]|jgi:hypothetical protein